MKKEVIPKKRKVIYGLFVLDHKKFTKMKEQKMNSRQKFGVMLDCSRNAVMKPERVKKFVDIISAFGYNCIQLYTEDTFEVSDEPYFGYLRGRYTKNELKELDAYCLKKGVELIPCVQTLAHVNQIFRWNEYARTICDTGDILLVDEERTYALIENIFKTLAECFTSRIVNIGMDEAHLLGRGKYLDKHGYVNPFDILNRHLRKVLEIAAKYGFTCMMWSDMFIRIANNGEYFRDNIVVTEKARESVPQGVNLVYWDYYHAAEKEYDKMIAAHKKLVSPDRIWFAGGAWVWKGFAPDNAFTCKTMKSAMRSCRANGVKNVFITLWGDDGKECSYFSVLPSLYYIKKIYDGETDTAAIKQSFKQITGVDFDALCALDLANSVQGGNKINSNASKYMLYSDPFSGFADYTVKPGVNAEFASAARKLARKAKGGGEFKYIFDCLKLLCDVLALKAELGVKLRAAYKVGDKDGLSALVKDMKKIEKRLEVFFKAFQTLWYTDNKPQGFEVQEVRIGGLMRRVKSCREMIEEYLNGEITEIPELAQEILPYGEKGVPSYINAYARNASVNVFSHEF